MRLPQLQNERRSSSGQYSRTTKDMIEIFKGYDHNFRIADNFMYDMENLTGDRYPILSQRKKRGIIHSEYKATAGIFGSDNFFYINGTVLYRNGIAIKEDLSPGLSNIQRQFVQLGAKLVIWPDKIIYNTEDGLFENIDNTVEVHNVEVSLVTEDGESIEAEAKPTAPESPSDKAYWIDTSEKPHILKQYSEENEKWIAIPTTYVMLKADGISKGFQADETYDAVSFNGFKNFPDLNTEKASYKMIKKLNVKIEADLYSADITYKKGNKVSHLDDNVLKVYEANVDIDEPEMWNINHWTEIEGNYDYIITSGIVDEEGTEDTVTIARECPEMDFITSCNNRIWGCSSENHEIYSCKLGDPTNWRVYQGVASDSYSATVGSPGKFTGAAVLGSYVLFFKENVMHKLYGTRPANYTFQEVSCRGVSEGSWRSLAVVNESLYYLSRSGVMVYNGSLPVSISDVFADKTFRNGVAGNYDNKYYISMYDDEEETYTMYVFDYERKLWFKEDDIEATRFAKWNGELFFTTPEGRILSVNGSTEFGDGASYGSVEDYIPWMAESGNFGLSLSDQKWLSRIVLRIDMDFPSTFRLYISYDDGEFELQEDIRIENNLDSYSIPIVPRRCDHFKIKISGEGKFKLYSISKIIEQGSEYR